MKRRFRERKYGWAYTDALQVEFKEGIFLCHVKVTTSFKNTACLLNVNIDNYRNINKYIM